MMFTLHVTTNRLQELAGQTAATGVRTDYSNSEHVDKMLQTPWLESAGANYIDRATAASRRS
jgi:hypothetical protein